LKIAIDIGALLSSFSVALAALNAGGRIVFTMSRRRLFPSFLDRSHPRFRTPHMALGAFAGVAGVVGAGMLLGGVSPLDAFNDTATLGAFGFVAIYMFVALGAPVYLKRRGELRPHHIALAVFTLALLLIPAVGSVYPVPPPPGNTFPYIFAIYFLIGVVLLWGRSGRLELEEPEFASASSAG
jgi:amino acid transporter